jgi:hypothetical protein
MTETKVARGWWGQKVVIIIIISYPEAGELLAHCHVKNPLVLLSCGVLLYKVLAMFEV